MCGIVGTASRCFQTDTELLCRMRDSMSIAGLTMQEYGGHLTAMWHWLIAG